ncbi:DUF3376 domain-containing protein [Agromyces rhizosphaerae]|uniref:DUF3376 domain-containing protein n=1 Tax=Agromyces rhizosphaerae TaxID=88374 RepID=UPI002491A14D|nr:DUF3376 domain-containing protein [Agromyces rhizosphaerae]
MGTEATGRAVQGGPKIRVVPVTGETRLADAAKGAEPAFGRTLRVSLAMRGGVSLAVWIGGAVAELDLLRRIRLYERDGAPVAFLITPGAEPPTLETRLRASIYAELLWMRGYDRVEFDLLAGTSAGGLNAVVYAVAQRAGASIDALRIMWADVGGLWGLLNLPGRDEIHALMRGEDLFRREVHRGLTEIYATQPSHPDLRAEHVDVDLSATAIDARDELEPDSNEGRAHFRFRATVPQGRTNRIPSRHDHEADAREDDLSLDRLALAARSTSSLPGGFEPAEITSRTRIDRTLHGGPMATGDRDDLRHAFSGHREPPDVPYRVVDGAVFDNVPIERAMRAARGRASERNADRVLLFLDPDPDPGPDDLLAWDAGASRFFRAIGAQVSRMFRTEPVARETADVQRFNATRRVEDARRRAAVSLVESAGWSQAAVEDRRAAYVRAMGASVAERLADAISGPSLWQVSTDLEQRCRYLPIARTRLLAFTEMVEGDYRQAADDEAARDARLVSASALADAANCVLAWARDLEAIPEADGARRLRSFPEVRATAYSALELATAHVDRSTARVLEHVRRFVLRAHPRRLAQPRREEARPWMRQWRISDTEPGNDLRDAWYALDACVADLLAENARLTGTPDGLGSHAEARATASPWTMLRVPASGVTPGAVDLAALMCPAGIPPALSPVGYWSIGVDERPDRPFTFTALHAGQRRAALQEALRAPTDRDLPGELLARLADTPETSTLTPQSKLAGYGLGNFLGFLSASWRVNDWLWGRLDAAAGVVRFFDSLEPNRVRASAAIRIAQDTVLSDADHDAEVVERAATGDPGNGGAERTPLVVPPVVDPPFQAPTPSARARLRGGVDALGDLPPGYLVGIASRGLRLIDRVALRPAHRIARWLLGALLAVLRPVLAVLPAVIDPPRAAAIAGVVGGAGWVLSWRALDAPGPWAWIGAGLVAAGLVGWLVAAGWGSDERWRRVREAVRAQEHGGDLAADRVEDAESASRLAATAPMFLAVVAIAVAATAILAGNPLMAVLTTGTAVVFVVAAARSFTAVPRPVARVARLRAWAGVSTLVALGVVVPLLLQASGAADRDEALALLSAGVVPSWPAALVVLAVAGAAVSTLLLAGWLPPFWRRRRARPVDLVRVTAYAVAAGAVAWIVPAGVAWAATGDPTAAPGWQAVAFLIAWANVVWWMPDRVTEGFTPDDAPRRAAARTG